jgi:hypothetical protein
MVVTKIRVEHDPFFKIMNLPWNSHGRFPDLNAMEVSPLPIMLGMPPSLPQLAHMVLTLENIS